MFKLLLIKSVSIFLVVVGMVIFALNVRESSILAYIVSSQPRISDIQLLDFDLDIQINLEVTDLFPGELSWSPFGNALVFSAYTNEQRRLYIYSFETGVTRLPIDDDVFNPQWSPDGHKILYVRESLNGNAALEIYDLENSSDRELAGLVFGFYAATWSPDGTQVAYAEQFQINEPKRIQIQSLDVSYPSRTIAEGMESVDALAWSPDGRTLACLCISRQLPLRGKHLILIDVETMEQRAVREADTRQYQPLLSWTPDNAYLLTYNIFGYHNYSKVRLSDGVITQIATIDASSNPQLRLGIVP